MRTSAALRLCPLLIASLAVGCAPAVQLAHQPLPPAAAAGETVVVGDINNQRPQGQGGPGFDLVGRVRGGYGNPFTLKTKKDRPLDVVLREVATDALAHVGYGVAEPTTAGSAPQLVMDVKNFWCDGYQGYKVDSIVVVKLVDEPSGRVLAEREISVARGFSVVIGYGSMQGAFNGLLDDMKSKLVEFAGSPEFRAAVGGS